MHALRPRGIRRPTDAFLGTRFLSTRFLGTRFLGTRFLGTRFLGTRFLGTRFLLAITVHPGARGRIPEVVASQLHAPGARAPIPQPGPPAARR